jgi:hypothetical protein
MIDGKTADQMGLLLREYLTISYVASVSSLDECCRLDTGFLVLFISVRLPLTHLLADI